MSMSVSSALSFKVVSAVQDILDPYIFKNGPWVHLATVTRSLPDGRTKEYVAFKRLYDMEVWIEELDLNNGPYFSKQIEDDQEWEDLKNFLQDAQLLHIGLDVEVRLGRRLAEYMETNYGKSTNE